MLDINHKDFDIEVIRGLADETRLEILKLLSNREMHVNQIADKSKLSRPTISHHLQIMKRSGILVARKAGKEIYYSVNTFVLTSLAESILKFVDFSTVK